jgi:hypothetical protein
VSDQTDVPSTFGPSQCFVSGTLGQCVGQDVQEDVIFLGPTYCPKTSLTDYLLTLCNIPEDGRP